MRLHPDLSERLQGPCATLARISYTQWKAWLSFPHRIRLLIALRKGGIPVGSSLQDTMGAATGDAVAGNSGTLSHPEQLALLSATGRFPGDNLLFQRSEELCIALLRSLRMLLPSVQQPIAQLPPSIGSLFKRRDETLADLRYLL